MIIYVWYVNIWYDWYVKLKQTECEYTGIYPLSLLLEVLFISQESKLSPMAVCMTEFFPSFD